MNILLILPTFLIYSIECAKISGDANAQRAQELVQNSIDEDVVEPPGIEILPPAILPMDDSADNKTQENSSTNSSLIDFDLLTELGKFKDEENNKIEQQEEEEEEIDPVKELIKNVKFNETDYDYYVTSTYDPIDNSTNSMSFTIIPSNETEDLNLIKDINVKSMVIKINETEEPINPYEIVEETSSDSPTTQSAKKTKTCVDLEELPKIDSNVVLNGSGMKIGKIEVSLELDGVDSKVNKKRESIENNWKKYELDCDLEDDEKGKVCKLWAQDGLCAKHRPTMFLFCRKTCLCVGP